MSPIDPRHAAGDTEPAEEERTRLAIRRRDALKFLASGLAVTLAGCTDPKEIIVPYEETIIPYVDMPEGLVPGEPQYYATALPMAGFGRGALVKAIDGRPIKVEGNPRHPASLGATDIFMQAEILSLYEPDRSGTVAGPQPVATWETFFTALVPRMRALDGTKGEGLHLVTGRITSPTLKRQIAGLMKAFPQARWHAYEPAEGDLASLPAGRSRPRLDKADVIVSLDADPLGPGPDQIVNGHEFAARRNPSNGNNVSRVYVVESSRTLTGANCDHRLSLRPDQIEGFAKALAAHVAGGSSNAADELPKAARNLLNAIVGDVTLPGIRAVLLPGETLSPETRTALTKANQKLGAEFQTTTEDLGGLTPLADFWPALEAGKVSDLLMLDCNPVYDFPDATLAGAIKQVAFSVHAGTLQNETARMSRWHVPLSHVLESWSDVAATDGTVSIVQPLIRPLYATRTTHEIVAMMMGDPAPSAYETVRQTWRGGRNDADFETWWRKTLTAGIVPAADVAAATSNQATSPSGSASLSPAPAKAGKGEFTAVIRPDPSLYDGAHADNALLQECPKPIGKTTWTNVVTLSEGDARKLGVGNDDVVSVEAAAGKIEGPVLVDKAQADGIVGLTLGYGRTAAGAIGTGLGYNARQLSSRSFASLVPAVDVKAAGRRQLVPTTQDHFKLEGDFQHLMPIVTGAADFRIDSEARPSSGQHFNHPNPKSDGYSWAMVIDNAACIGCNACVIACQVENNVPVVGPDEVANTRIMQWLRIDRYEREDSHSQIGGFEPVPCMQCEKAPCEPVCPVEASVHDIEGLNNQVYNRCVGTRFCQTNCPYKVRHFNWFAYDSGQEYKNLGQNPMPASKNPDVTVRGRGVMEKCTYCVQRISRARKHSEIADERIPDGGVVTACQQACPTNAIQFGNLQDLGSRVSKLRFDPRHFTLLEELGTSPRTTYLARIRNDNSLLKEDES